MPAMFQGLLYTFCRGFCRLLFRVWGRVEVIDAGNVPDTGSLLIASNHQSYLDPPLVGGGVRRHMHFVARSGLFKFRPFAWLIASLNSIPLRENEGDAAAIREVLRRLGDGHGVVIFPEGARTTDGAMHEFKRGVIVLVKKAKCPVVPAAVEGCWDAYPPGGKPRLFGVRLAVKYGKAIPYDELFAEGADGALTRLQREVDAMRLDLRARLRARTNGRWPAPGPGDEPVLKSITDDPAASD
ncbi:MAG: 1-acyl-sn-glycerol-3-phosphate acyltransferase [Phycisphaerales bacterium]|nr:MAG: 1-acyl-sn-glycerol-3-phosphate acyltransferase [Phycisphaerales bacterium]